MTSLEPKSPYPRHSPYSRDPVDPPSRSRVFSQLDNLTPNQSRTFPNEYTKQTETTDKIAQIKKKYDKLLNKSTTKPQASSDYPPKDYNRPTPKATENKSAYTVRPYDYSHDRENIYHKTVENSITPKKIQPYIFGSNESQKKEWKSQIDSNRSALTQMKSQLQARLNELSTKTIMNSALRKQQDTKPAPNDNTERQDYYKTSVKQVYGGVSLSKGEKKSYQQISEKYTKIDRYTHEKPFEKERQTKKSKRVEERSKDHLPQSYIKKYSDIAAQNGKNRVIKPQLSIISEKSNSNKSESFNNIDLQDISKDTKVESSDVKEIVNPQYEDLFKKDLQEKPKQSLQEKRWLKSTCSYFEEKPETCLIRYQKSSSNNDPPQNNSLYQLQKSVGPIKRTETEENLSRFSKNPLVTSEVSEQKERLLNNYIDNSNEKFVVKQIGTNVNDIKEATFGKKNETYDLSSTKNPEPSPQGQLQKFKEKYTPTPSGSIRENPYREPEKKHGWKNYQFRDNKDLSSKIDKIDQRIKEIQANKRNLNINFRPYEAAKSTPKYTKHQHHELEPKQNLLDKYSVRPSAVPPKQTESYQEENKSTGRPRISSYLDRVRPMYSESTIPQASKSHSNGFSIKLHPVEISNEEDNLSSYSASKTQSEWKTKMEIQSRTDCGIQERKKKRQEKFEANNNIKSLVTILSQQAVYDEVFRNNKIWFASESKDNKWELLQKQLKSVSVHLTQSEIRDQFQLLQSENNPFFSVSDSKCDITSLVKSYVQAQKHWQQKVAKRFRKESLEKEGLTVGKLDLDKKGYILIEDLVRFLNIESGTFLRNRDVSIIFRRINTKNEKVTFENILSAICL